MSSRPRPFTTSFLLLALGIAALAAASTAFAANPGEVRFPIAGCHFGSIAPAPGGGVLLRTCESAGSGSTLLNLTADGRSISRPIPESSPGRIMAGTGGEVWFVAGHYVATEGERATIERLAADGGVQSFPLAAPRPHHDLEVTGLTIGSDGALWATTGEPAYIGPGYATAGGTLVRIATDGSEQSFPLPSGIEPQGIVLGPEGNLWFTAVRGQYLGEHSQSKGVGYVGRATPDGEVALYPTPIEGSEPSGIVVGPYSRLWFVEGGADRIGTVSADGTFGREYKLRLGTVGRALTLSTEGMLTFDSRGDLWVPSPFLGLTRLTPDGQQTFFPGGAESVARGAEGDVWALAPGVVRRIRPGAPGIDVQRVVADRRSGTVRVLLACGGSRTGCEGTLSLSLRLPRFRFVRTGYEVGPEARRTLKLKIPEKTFALVIRHRHRWERFGQAVVARATVHGGPTLRRGIDVPSLLPGRPAANATM